MTIGTPTIIKCPSCKRLQKRMTLRSGNTFGAIFYSDGTRDAPMLPEIPYVEFLEIDEYVRAINLGLFNGNECDILPLRLALWRAFNKCARFNDDEKTYRDNCLEILAKMTRESHDDEQHLICAELWRNIGEFDKCKSSLGKINLPDKFEAYITAITAACDEKNTLTVQIN